MFWFADDGSFAVTGPQEWCRGQLQEALHICFEWCPEFKMTFSAAKSLAMVFSLSKGLIAPGLKLGSVTIPVVKSVKLLGVIVIRIRLLFEKGILINKFTIQQSLILMY